MYFLQEGRTQRQGLSCTSVPQCVPWQQLLAELDEVATGTARPAFSVPAPSTRWEQRDLSSPARVLFFQRPAIIREKKLENVSLAGHKLSSTSELSSTPSSTISFLVRGFRQTGLYAPGTANGVDCLTHALRGAIIREDQVAVISSEKMKIVEDVKSVVVSMRSAWDIRGLTPVTAHKIKLEPGVVPVKQRYGPRNPAMQEIINRELNKMLEQGIVEPSHSPGSSPVVIVQDDLQMRT